jgi:hypothetical protein
MSADATRTAGRPRLVGLAGSHAGVTLALGDGPFGIGRSSANALVLTDPGASRLHAVIEPDGSGWRLRDLASRRGTLVNGRRVDVHRIAPLDVIEIGDCVLAFVVGDDNVTPIRVSDVGTAATHDDLFPVDDAALFHPESLLGRAGTGPIGDGLDVLARLSVSLVGRRDAHHLAREVVLAALSVIPADRGGVVLAEGTGARTRFRPLLALGRGTAAPETIDVSRTVASRVIDGRTSVLDNDVERDAGWNGVDSLRETGVRAVLCVPIPLFDEIIGVLYFDSSTEGTRFDERHLQLGIAIAALAAIPLDAARQSAFAARAVPPHEDRSCASAMVLDVQGPLHLGTVLQLLPAFDRVRPGRDRPFLLLDHGTGGGSGGEGFSPALVERIALVGDDRTWAPAAASRAPCLARLAALVASLGSDGPGALVEGRAWLRDLLLTSGLIALRARHVAMEPRAAPARAVAVATAGAADGAGGGDGDGGAGNVDGDRAIGITGALLRHPGPPAALLAARRIATRLAKAQPGRWIAPEPLASGHPPFLALDDDGPMGRSAKGTLFVSDSADAIAKKVRSARTDDRTELDPSADMSLPVRNLVLLLHALGGEPVDSMLGRLAGKGYGVLKTELADAANAYLAPIRLRLELLDAHGGIAERLEPGTAALDASAREAAELVSSDPACLR